MQRLSTQRILAYSLIPVLLVVLANVAGLRYNYTNSVAGKLWLERPAKNLQRNDYVFLCIQDSGVIEPIKYYLIDGDCAGHVGMLKKIVGVQGDQVEFTAKGILINGAPIENTKPVDPEKLLHKLVPYQQHQVVATDQFVVVGETANSLDSRYYGPVDRKWITGKALRLF